MASYHCEVKAGPSASAAGHARYIQRHEKESELEAVESGNMPRWAASQNDFWKASDDYERVNASGYREIEVALPRELSAAQRLALVKDFVAQQLGTRHTYTFAIRNRVASLEGGEHPHAHIMFSERVNDEIERLTPQHYFKLTSSKDPVRGGCKKIYGAFRTFQQRKADLLALRQLWADVQNKHLEMHGSLTRVDHRSLKNQGIERAPEVHLGPRHVHVGSPAVRRVLQARIDHRLSIELEIEIGVAQRRLDRLVKLANAREARQQFE